MSFIFVTTSEPCHLHHVSFSIPLITGNPNIVLRRL